MAPRKARKKEVISKPDEFAVNFEKQKQSVFWVILVLFGGVTIATMSAILATGLGYMHFSDSVLHWLIGAVVSEVIGMMYYLVKHFFHK